MHSLVKYYRPRRPRDPVFIRTLGPAPRLRPAPDPEAREFRNLWIMAAIIWAPTVLHLLGVF